MLGMRYKQQQGAVHKHEHSGGDLSGQSRERVNCPVQ